MSDRITDPDFIINYFDERSKTDKPDFSRIREPLHPCPKICAVLKLWECSNEKPDDPFSASFEVTTWFENITDMNITIEDLDYLYECGLWYLEGCGGYIEFILSKQS